MAVSKDEHLSALVDDEAGEFERRRMVDELVASEQDRQRWSRYHLIGDVMRGDTPPVIESGFAARISAAIEDEEIEAIPAAGRMRRVAKPAAGFAMAASVAVATVLGVQGLMSADKGLAPEGQNTITAEAPAVAPSGIRQVAVTRDSSTARPEARQAVNLNSYIVRHTEHAAQHGMLPQARVVGYTASGE